MLSNSFVRKNFFSFLNMHISVTSQWLCSLEILTMYWKHSYLVNCVSEFVFGTCFLFYDKKQETFYGIYGIIFLDFIGWKLGPI